MYVRLFYFIVVLLLTLEFFSHINKYLTKPINKQLDCRIVVIKYTA